jgi:hypothetical protein
LNNYLLYNPWLKEEMKKENKLLEANANVAGA